MKKKEPDRYKLTYKYTVIEEMEEIYPETGMKLIRPTINYTAAILKVLLTLVIVSVLVFASVVHVPFIREWGISLGGKIALLYLALIFLSCLICARWIIIFVIRVYQRYGSYAVRSKCMYIPNCSEYMILAIRKYGVIRGVTKGINRMKRCCEPYVGGTDYP